MSCQAQTVTNWVEASSVYETTQYETYTTTMTNYPHPVETYVLESWCATPEATYADSSPTDPSATSSSTPEHVSETVEVGARGLAAKRQLPSSASAAPGHTPVTGGADHASPTGTQPATVARHALDARQDAPSGCIWTTHTHWTMHQPSPTETVVEITSTSTGWNTLHTSVPSVSIQACTGSASDAISQPFWTGSSGWILHTSDGSVATPTNTVAAALTWTEVTTISGVSETPSRAEPTSLLLHNSSSTPVASVANTGQSSHTGLPTAARVESPGIAATSLPHSVASASRLSLQVLPTASINSSTLPIQDGSSSNPTSSTKAGWAGGAIGVVLLLGFFAWFYFQRRKKQEEQARYGNDTQANEKGSFLGDFSDKEGGSESYGGDDALEHVPLYPIGETGKNERKQQTKLQQPGSHFSLNSPLRNLYGLSRPVAKALNRPLSTFGQIGPPRRMTPTTKSADAGFTNPLPATFTRSPPSSTWAAPRTQAVQPKRSELQHGQEQQRDASAKHIYHYRKHSHAETPIRLPAEPVTGFEVHGNNGDADEHPTALSPNTSRLLVEAMTLPISSETERPEVYQPLTVDSYRLPQHTLSVASAYSYLEPEVETAAERRRHTYRSSWCTKSIFKGLFTGRG